MAKGVVSSRPVDTVAGGLLNDADVEIIGAKWCHYDYEGKSSVVRFCAAITMAVLIDGNPADEHLNYYGAGKASDWIPDEADGDRTPLKVGNATSFVSGSNWILFVDSAIKAGVDESKFVDSDLGALIGLRCHVIRKATNRTGMRQQQADDREQTVLLIDHLVKPVTRGTMNKPGSRTVAQAPATTTSTAPAQASAPATDIGDPTETVSGILGELLGAASDRTLATIALQAKAATKINSLVKEPSARQAYTQALKAILNSDDLLANIGAMADRAANKISLAGE